MDDAHAVAERFGIRQNMRREKYGLAFALQLFDEISHLSSSHGIES